MSNYLQSTFDLDSEKLISLFDELPLWAAPFGLKLLDRIPYNKNQTVLDIGFGAGFPLTELAMRLGSSSKIYGIDPWEAASKRAKRKISQYNIPNIELINGVAEDIPLEAESIDLITSNNGINNVSDLDKSLSECYRVLKQSGHFIQTMNLENTMFEFYEVLELVLTSLGCEEELINLKRHIQQKRKPLDDFLLLLETKGFKNVLVEQDSFKYTFADGTTMLNHYFIRLAFLDSWKSIIPLEKQQQIFDRVEDMMNASAQKNGNFILTIPFVLIHSIKSIPL